MSVIHFSAAELANAYSYLTAGSPKHDDALFAAFAAYSVGNTAAFNERYSESAKPVTARELKSAAASITFDRVGALGTLRLLTYNGPEGEGLKAGAPYARAVAEIMDCAFKRLLEQTEERR